MGFFDKIQETITTAADQTKAKAHETQSKMGRKKKLEAIGVQAYNLYIAGQLTQGELVAGCQEVAEVDRQIAELEQQARAARPQPTAAAPGEPVQAPPPPPQAPPPPGGTPRGGGTPPPPA